MSNPPVTPGSPAAAPESYQPPTDFDIAEEYGTARKNLPPARIVLICLAIVVAIAAVYSLSHRAHPRSSGTITDVVAAAVPGQQSMVMVAINVSLQNNEQKPTWIKTIHVSADLAGNTVSDDAVPAVDAQSYFQSIPGLKEHALQILTPETRINPGEKISATVVVSFPVTAEAFAARKSLTVSITPYDEVPLVLTK